MSMQDERYSAAIFFNAVLPLLREIVERTPLKKVFQGKNGVIQISARDTELMATHFIVTDGNLQTMLGAYDKKPDIELAFKDLPSFNAFFKGTSRKMPSIRGFRHPALLIATFRALLKMAALLSETTPPSDPKEKALLTRLYYYLLSSGISQLNKAGHPLISTWTKRSPDRVYAWTVDEDSDVAAYLRIKAGKSRAARGRYTRSKPFFTMRFDTFDSALSILLGQGDMIDMVASQQLILEGAPEFGAQIGEYMLLVGSYAKG